jgi:hypothetical protein
VFKKQKLRILIAKKVGENAPESECGVNANNQKNYPLTIKSLSPKKWGRMLRNLVVFVPCRFYWGRMLRNPETKPDIFVQKAPILTVFMGIFDRITQFYVNILTKT